MCASIIVVILFSEFFALILSMTVNYICIYFFHHTMRESTCDTLPSSAANQGDNTVSVAQGFIVVILSSEFFALILSMTVNYIYIYIYIYIYVCVCVCVCV